MMDITHKSTGMLFDELYTYDMRIALWPDREDLKDYRHKLGNLIVSRFLVLADNFDAMRQIWIEAAKLKQVSKACWDAQEIMKTRDDKEAVAAAAINARLASLERNACIRAIDQLIGERYLSPIRKV